MAQIALNNATYTQLNTVDSAYLVQNTSGSPILVSADAAPVLGDGGFVLQNGQAIGNGDIAAILWGITLSPSGAVVEVAE